MNLQEIEKSVIDICIEVGQFIRHEGANFDHARVEQKDGFNNLVSYVDKEAERRLVAVFKKLLPEAGYITEEGTVAQSTNHEYNWIIDALDGTTNFLHGFTIYANSVSLTRRKKISLGLI